MSDTGDYASPKMQTHWWPPPLTCAEVLEKSWDAQQLHGLFMHIAIFRLLRGKKQAAHLTFKGKGT